MTKQTEERIDRMIEDIELHEDNANRDYEDESKITTKRESAYNRHMRKAITVWKEADTILRGNGSSMMQHAELPCPEIG